MPAFAFTGSRHLPPDHQKCVEQMIDALPYAAVVITGACMGVDAYVARYAYTHGFKVITVVPSKRDLVDPDWRQYCHEFVEMPPRTTYRDRNQTMVEIADDGVRAIADKMEHDPLSRYSGTWMTVRIARRKQSVRPNMSIHIHVMSTERWINEQTY